MFQVIIVKYFYLRWKTTFCQMSGREAEYPTWSCLHGCHCSWRRAACSLRWVWRRGGETGNISWWDPGSHSWEPCRHSDWHRRADPADTIILTGKYFTDSWLGISLMLTRNIKFNFILIWWRFFSFFNETSGNWY